MTKTKRGLSEAERAERRARDRERLQHAARQLLTSDGWQRWVRARALFHNYSLRNCLLLAAQCHERGIHARRVAGFRTWLKLGRCVRKGEKALVVLAPMPIKRRESNEEPDEARVVFRSAFVFADSQTDLLPGVDPAPIEPPCEPLTGDSHRHLLEHLRSFAREIDFEVALEPISGSVGGWCDPKRRRVVVDAGLPANAQVRVLVPWRKGRLPTFGMLPREAVAGGVCRAGRSEARRASGDPPERCRSGGGGGGEAGVARPVAGGGAAPVVGGVIAVAEQLAEDWGGDAGGEREQRRGAAGLGVDAELAQAATDALGPDVGARLSAGQQPRSGGLGVHGAEQCGEWVGDVDRVLAEREEDLWATEVEVIAAQVTMRVTRWPYSRTRQPATRAASSSVSSSSSARAWRRRVA